MNQKSYVTPLYRAIYFFSKGGQPIDLPSSVAQSDFGKGKTAVFEDYLEAYKYCSDHRDIALIFLEFKALSENPKHFMDQLFEPFEVNGEKGAVVLIAKDSSEFVQAYQMFLDDGRLIQIVLREEFLSSLRVISGRYKRRLIFQKKNLLCSELELDILMSLCDDSKKRSLIWRVTNLFTQHLELDWSQTSFIDFFPTLDEISSKYPDIIKKRKNLARLHDEYAPFLKMDIISLVNLTDGRPELQCAVMAKVLVEMAQVGDIDVLDTDLAARDALTKGAYSRAITILEEAYPNCRTQKEQSLA